MFGHQSAPSKIYGYKARKPIQGGGIEDEQIKLAHRYRNRIVEIELERRRLTDEKLNEIAPDLAELERQKHAAEQAVEDLLVSLKQDNIKARSKRAGAARSPELRLAKQTLKEARAAHKTRRLEVFADPATRDALAGIEDQAKASMKQARAECGLYWGTYLVVEQAMSDVRKGPPPRYKAFRGEGQIAVQIQGGMEVSEALLGTDTRFRLEVTNRQDQGDEVCYAVASLRVGSDGRKPIWARYPIVFHRMPPEGSRIKWIYLNRCRVGTHYVRSLSLVISRDEGFDRDDWSTDGLVAIDPGWRKMGGDLRVARWVGIGDQVEDWPSVQPEFRACITRSIDERGREVGELRIPAKEVSRWSKAESLQSIRDRNFDEIKAWLSAWLKSRPDLPRWMTERTAFLSQWRAQSRLASVSIAWRDQRFPGDSEAFDRVEAWRKQDKHLYDWQANQRRKAIAWRDNLYRWFMRMLARRYRQVVIENTNWQELCRNAEPDQIETIGVKDYARIASVGRMLELSKEAFAEPIKVPAEYTTKRCHVCGEIDDFDAAKSIRHQCTHCGATWDQDVNACHNLIDLCDDARAEVVA